MVLRVKLLSTFAVFLLVVTALSHRCSAQASITLSKKIGPPTSSLQVSGSGFQPNIGVDIYFDNQDEALAVTDGQGQFSPTRIGVPTAATPGHHSVSAIGRNNGGAAQGRFIVNTDWSQTGFAPDQLSWNPYENVLNPANVNHLEQLWFSYFGDYGAGPESEPPTTYQGRVYVSYLGGGLNKFDAFNEVTGGFDWDSNLVGSPAAISDGVVYSTNVARLAAFNAATGALLGEFTFEEGDNDWVSPPVTAGDAVFFGTTSGFFYAVNRKTGSLLWSVSGRGDIQSPAAVGDGNVYFCSSTCYAYYAPNGFPRWQYSGGSGATPAVSESMVVVNGPQGTTALDPSYGTVLWQFGPSDSNNAVAIADGVVYVTGKTEVFALDGATGSLLWDQPIADGFSPSVANGVVYVSVGYPSERLYALDAVSGKILWDYDVVEYVTSAPAVVNGRVFITSVDIVTGYGVLYAFGLKK